MNMVKDRKEGILFCFLVFSDFWVSHVSVFIWVMLNMFMRHITDTHRQGFHPVLLVPGIIYPSRFFMVKQEKCSGDS